MPLDMKKIWERLFLEERPSLGLSFFRIFAGLTVGLHVIPSFFYLKDNFLSTAFKQINTSFFPPETVWLVQQSPDWLVYLFVAIFSVSWFFFCVGLYSQASCIIMTLSCYYFYALNSLHIGTLSWDILLVTLFLMCLTGYHGDYFSVDALRRHDALAYKRQRSFFIQRLLQMQMAATFFYTALYKITADGNWLRGNPVYYLLNYPPEGVTKEFIFRNFFAAQPEICYAVGVFIVVAELSMPFLWFIPQTRNAAIAAGFLFHIMLVVTLHVPTIFFFLFPAQMLLFIHPNRIVQWVEKKRSAHAQKRQARLIYDGQCRFCRGSIEKILIADLFGYIKPVDYHEVTDIGALHQDLTRELCHSQLHLVGSEGRLLGGFFIFRHLAFKIPMLYPFIFVFYFPGSGVIGPWVYRWIAKNRYLFHVNRTCQNNACFR